MLILNGESVHRCGNSWQHCNGDCSACDAGNTYTTTSTDLPTLTIPYDTDAFGKPSKEAYERAKENKKFASNALWECRNRRDKLIDDLAKERENEKRYMELYEMNRDIIRKYEIYEELDADG